MLTKKTTVAAVVLALLWQWLVWCSSRPPRPTDPRVAEISKRFQSLIDTAKVKDATTTGTTATPYSIQTRGYLNWDQETFLWNRFAEQFGINFNTPYMYSVMPLLFGVALPSPMWRLRHHDAVVLLAKPPPSVDYFSFTTFCLWSWKRGFVFASLGDSLNSHNSEMQTTTTTMTKANHKNGVFAHVVVTERSRQTLEGVQQLLVESGVSVEAIHVAVVPNTLLDDDSWSLFEVVLRLFRFHNQTEGDTYLQSKQPVFYVRGTPPQQTTSALAKPAYKDRAHADSVNEYDILQGFDSYQDTLVADVAKIYQVDVANSTNEINWVQRIPFGALYIRGLHCIQNGTQCLGDCPDAAYFGSNIQDETDSIQALSLRDDDELHLISMVDHRRTKASIYSSVAVLKSPSAIINKTHMDVRGTPLGVMSNLDFHYQQKENDTDDVPLFFSWIFTRNPDHCTTLSRLVQGCTVIDEREVARRGHFAYCERIYLNPVTGTGPDWNNIVPAQLYHLRNLPK